MTAFGSVAICASFHFLKLSLHFPFTHLSKSAPSLSRLSHADVARSRRRRVISAVEPDEPASNFQQRDNTDPTKRPSL
jgi:hypothetical protein